MDTVGPLHRPNVIWVICVPGWPVQILRQDIFPRVGGVVLLLLDARDRPQLGIQTRASTCGLELEELCCTAPADRARR